jgi:hypothetical protein
MRRRRILFLFSGDHGSGIYFLRPRNLYPLKRSLLFHPSEVGAVHEGDTARCFRFIQTRSFKNVYRRDEYFVRYHCITYLVLHGFPFQLAVQKLWHL